MDLSRSLVTGLIINQHWPQLAGSRHESKAIALGRYEYFSTGRALRLIISNGSPVDDGPIEKVAAIASCAIGCAVPVGIGNRARRRYGDFSGGKKQRAIGIFEYRRKLTELSEDDLRVQTNLIVLAGCQPGFLILGFLNLGMHPPIALAPLWVIIRVISHQAFSLGIFRRRSSAETKTS
ncbi:MAG: hypothetical protein GDA56_20175 [Hormoscilla sp. GM7CHS1pb]|nr:hypothetical protein [Hormoscilla sp. GM7CHS1pb]